MPPRISTVIGLSGASALRARTALRARSSVRNGSSNVPALTSLPLGDTWIWTSCGASGSNRNSSGFHLMSTAPTG